MLSKMHSTVSQNITIKICNISCCAKTCKNFVTFLPIFFHISIKPIYLARCTKLYEFRTCRCKNMAKNPIISKSKVTGAHKQQHQNSSVFQCIHTIICFNIGMAFFFVSYVLLIYRSIVRMVRHTSRLRIICEAYVYAFPLILTIFYFSYVLFHTIENDTPPIDRVIGRSSTMR